MLLREILNNGSLLLADVSNWASMRGVPKESGQGNRITTAGWYRRSLANTQKLYDAGVQLVFGTDTPLAFGNFFHSVTNEVRGLWHVAAAISSHSVMPEAMLKIRQGI